MNLSQQIDAKRQDRAFAARLKHRLAVDKPVLDTLEDFNHSIYNRNPLSYLEAIEETPEDDFERLAKAEQA